jgi:hypothetical protein
MSNNYDIDFVWSTTNTELLSKFKLNGVDMGAPGTPGPDANLIKVLCDEAQLPNVQASTGQTTGRYLGEGLVNYATGRVYNDFQLGWLGDGNLKPLKMLETWYQYIFGNESIAVNEKETPVGSSSTTNASVSGLKATAGVSDHRRTIRLNYPDKYQCKIQITKTDRGVSAANSRAPITYTMLNAWPYSIDAIPMSYGASQIVKVTANFYYSKYSISYNNLTNLAF